MKTFLLKHHFLLSLLSILLFLIIVPLLLYIYDNGWPVLGTPIVFIGVLALMIFNILFRENKDRPKGKIYFIFIYIFVIYFLLATIVLPLVAPFLRQISFEISM
ncbi:MAG: hypothetical protein LBV55_02110 [Acholeplasmatales bacterium]|jgi:hypothetical protein|nr:hypothetical protein [Acholeplasmatales bacterium]